MNFEKEYYEYDSFWNDYETLYRNNIEKINITFDFIAPDVRSLLDAACGSGMFTNMLIEKFPEIKVIAFDRSEAALKYVKTDKLIAEINDIPFEDKTFDCVVAHDVIEHLPVDIYERALDEIARVSAKYIIIGVPNNEKVMDRSTQCPSCKAIFNYDLHMRSFSKDKMKSLFQHKGFHCREIRTCDRNTFYFGQQWYSRTFVPKVSKVFKSPICPVCGYSEEEKNPVQTSNRTGADQADTTLHHQNKFIQLAKKVPRLLWPKYSFDYEMVALFQKTNL